MFVVVPDNKIERHFCQNRRLTDAVRSPQRGFHHFVNETIETRFCEKGILLNGGFVPKIYIEFNTKNFSSILCSTVQLLKLNKLYLSLMTYLRINKTLRNNFFFSQDYN